MKNLAIFVIGLISLVACQRTMETNNTLILVPANKTGPPIVLFGLNGAFCDPHVYIGLFQEIQSYSNYTIWVVLYKFPGNLPSNLDKAIPIALDELRQQGADTTTVFIVGHSLGGFKAQDFLATNSAGIKGLVLLGKFMRFKYQDPQINFPVPVLTISGGLDGLSKITRLAMSFNQMLRHPQQKGHLRYPVAIIPGAYHSSYITGEIPAFINASDIKPELSNQEVWNMCAQLTDAFVDAQLHIEMADTNLGAKFLFDYVYKTTYPLMKPLLDAFALEGNPYLYNTSLIGYTKWVVDNIFDEMNISAGALPTNITSQERGPIQFAFEKPAAFMKNGILSHQTYTYKSIGPVESDDMTSIPYQSAYWISVKYKSASFIYKTAKLPTVPAQISCKDLNQKAIDKVLETIPQKNLERYQKYGVKLIAGEDSVHSNSATWHLAKGIYEEADRAVYYSSPKLLTGLDSWFYPGDFYCKLLSPARVAEWIYVDSLRKYNGAGVNDTLSTVQV